MKTILNIIAAFVMLNCSYAYAEDAITKQYGDYQLQISAENPENFQRTARLYQHGKEVYSFSEHHIYELLYYKDGKLDLLGTGTPVLAMEADSGGTHCCRTYYFLELGQTFRHIQTIVADSGFIELVRDKRKKPYFISLYDGLFSYFYSSMAAHADAQPALPRIWLAYNGKQFFFDAEKMRQRVSKGKFKAISKKLSKKLAADPSLDYVLTSVLQLIYSGNVDLAWQLLTQAYTEHALYINNDYEKLPTQTELQEKILCTLKESSYLQELLLLNSGKIEMPEKCAVVSK